MSLGPDTPACGEHKGYVPLGTAPGKVDTRWRPTGHGLLSPETGCVSFTVFWHGVLTVYLEPRTTSPQQLRILQDFDLLMTTAAFTSCTVRITWTIGEKARYALPVARRSAATSPRPRPARLPSSGGSKPSAAFP